MCSIHTSSDQYKEQKEEKEWEAKKSKFAECAPLLSSVAADEKKKVLGSLKDGPDGKQARAILAGKLLERPDSPDVRELYEKIKE